MTSPVRRCALVLSLFVFASGGSRQEPLQDAEPTQAAAAQPVEPPEVTRILDRVADGYGKLQSLRLEASITGEYNAAGRSSRNEVRCTSAMTEDKRFRHEVPGELLIAADTEATYVYFPASLRYYRFTLDGTTTQPSHPRLRGAARQALVDHNPSLALALNADAAQALRSWGELEAGEAPMTLVQKRQDGAIWTLRFDEHSALLREITIDESAALAQAGVPDVTTARRRIEYTVSDADAAVPDEAVAFAIPDLAQEVEPAALAGVARLIGRRAPELELPDLEGKPVALSNFGGKVVVVDFWASWCAPCAHSLHHLKFLAKANEEQLAVMLVNLEEEAQTVRQFASDHELSGTNIHVVRDASGAIGESWGVTAIPYSVVIGRDGRVKRVIEGLSPDRLDQAVKAALAE